MSEHIRDITAQFKRGKSVRVREPAYIIEDHGRFAVIPTRIMEAIRRGAYDGVPAMTPRKGVRQG